MSRAAPLIPPATPPDRQPARQRGVVVMLAVLLPILGLGLPLLMPNDRQWVHLPLHAVIEVVGAMTALGLTTLLLLSWRHLERRFHHAWVAGAFLGMGILDGLHALLPPGNGFVWLHSAATGLGGLLFAGQWFDLHWTAARLRRFLPATLLVALGLGLPSLFLPHWPLPMLADGRFTPAARLINIVGGSGFLIGAAWFLLAYLRGGQRHNLVFAIIGILFGVAGLAFDLSRLWDAPWWWWHLLRLVAYGAALFLLASHLRDLFLARQAVERAYRAVVESAQEAIIVIDEYGRIERFNPAAESLFGWSADEAIGRNVRILMPEPHHSRHDDYLRNYRAGRGAGMMGQPRDLWGVRKDGGLVPVRLHLSETRIEGRRKFIGFLQDLREWHQAREERDATASQLEFTTRDFQELTYSLSHDIRTPLRAIDGFSALLAEDYGERLDATGHDYLRRIRAASQRMGEMLDDARRLYYYRQHDMDPTQVNLSEIATHILQSLRDQFPERRITCHVQPALFVFGDRRMLHELLYELLDNAFKFTKPRDEGVIEFGARQEADGIAYFVRDNGIGFERRYADKLFRTFERLHGHEFAGTGMGLARAQRIVELHKGRIRADAEPEGGTTLWFTLHLE